MTDQEAFDAMCRHLLGMKKQSTGDNGLCLYRGANDARCAVGALIPDEQYRPRFEMNIPLRDVVDSVPALQNLKFDMLVDVQRVHDDEHHWGRAGFLARGKEALRRVARDHGLSPAVLDSPS